MLMQLTIYHAEHLHLLDLCRVLRSSGLRISGRITRRSDGAVEVCVVSTLAWPVDSLCQNLLNQGLAQSVLLEHVEV
jgi:hypothetical protein